MISFATLAFPPCALRMRSSTPFARTACLCPNLPPRGRSCSSTGCFTGSRSRCIVVLGGSAPSPGLATGWGRRSDQGEPGCGDPSPRGWGLGAEGPLLDPVCGSGTLLVEGALMALGIPPGASRERSGHDRWVGAERTQWAALRAQSGAQERETPLRLVGRDADPEQLVRTQVHLEAAGLLDHPLLELDLAEGRLEGYAGTEMAPQLIVGNPPYGARLAASEDLLPTLGRTLVRHHPETKLAFIVGVPAGEESDARALIARLGIPGLKASALNNGALEAIVLSGATPAAPEAKGAAQGPAAGGPPRGGRPALGQSLRCGRSLRQPHPKKSCSPGALGAPSGGIGLSPLRPRSPGICADH